MPMAHAHFKKIQKLEADPSQMPPLAEPLPHYQTGQVPCGRTLPFQADGHMLGACHQEARCFLSVDGGKGFAAGCDRESSFVLVKEILAIWFLLRRWGIWLLAGVTIQFRDSPPASAPRVSLVPPSCCPAKAINAPRPFGCSFGCNEQLRIARSHT